MTHEPIFTILFQMRSLYFLHRSEFVIKCYCFLLTDCGRARFSSFLSKAVAITGIRHYLSEMSYFIQKLLIYFEKVTLKPFLQCLIRLLIITFDWEPFHVFSSR